MQDRGYPGRPGHEERRGFQVGKWSYGRRRGSPRGLYRGVIGVSSMFGEGKERWDNDKQEKDYAYKMAKNLMDTFNRE